MTGKDISCRSLNDSVGNERVQMKDMHGKFEVEVYLLSSSQVTAKQFM
jgi:hypothetical protein